MTPRRRKPGTPAGADKKRSAPASTAPEIVRIEEHRRAPRFSCDLVIAMNWGATVLEGRVLDISSEGMFVTLDQPLWIGAGFTARLGLQTPVRIECIVRRVEPFRGMGLTYSIPDQAGRAAVTPLLGQMERT